MNLQEFKEKWQISHCQIINKGWSDDKKYYLESLAGRKYLLRVALREKQTRKQTEFALMQAVFALGLRSPEPVDFVMGDDAVYTLFTWVSGEDAKNVLPTLSQTTEYDLGFQAGGMLKKMHTLSAPDRTEAWDSVFARKIERNINNYLACPIKYPKGDLILEYVAANRHLIAGRPSTFQHGDFHTGNMILSANNQLSIIDFNRWSVGDPWEEFNRIDFTAELSPVFAKGQIDGYFGKKPPAEFFRLLALYICTNLLNALPWALAYSEAEVAVMQRKANSVLEWFADMTEVVPTWYS